jgi:hypothetical protein
LWRGGEGVDVWMGRKSLWIGMGWDEMGWVDRGGSELEI